MVFAVSLCCLKNICRKEPVTMIRNSGSWITSMGISVKIFPCLLSRRSWDGATLTPPSASGGCSERVSFRCSMNAGLKMRNGCSGTGHCIRSPKLRKFPDFTVFHTSIVSFSALRECRRPGTVQREKHFPRSSFQGNVSSAALFPFRPETAW